MSPKEIRIDGVIGQAEGELSAAWLRAELPTNGTDAIRISMHSEGGSVFEGFAMYDILTKYAGPKSVAVESTAFSIASFVAMAADEIEMSPNAYFMLHNPRVQAEGDDDELGKQAAMITDLKANMISAYSKRTGKSPEEIQSILKAETYFNATDAVAFGLADRVTQSPVNGRAFARLDSIPHGVVTALFGVGSGGDNDSKKGKPMTESVPVAATVQQIRAAFPKAKAEFVLSCIEKSLPMASVATAAAEEMMQENEDLKCQVAALQEEIAKAKASSEEDAAAKAKAEGDPVEPDEDDMPDAKAKAKSSGAKPVAKGTAGRPSASVRWNKAIEDALPKCNGNKMKAVALANRQNPGLREEMLMEVNS